MTEPVDPVLDYLSAIHDAVLAMGVLLKQHLDRQHPTGNSGPVLLPQQPQQLHQQPAPVQAPPAFAPMEWRCPQHGSSRIVPAGISSRTGQPFQAFTVCGERTCDIKPGRAAAPARALPPGQMP